MSTPADLAPDPMAPAMDPAMGRRLWEQLLEASLDGQSEHADLFLTWICQSVLVDWIANRIARDDEFATVIGNRIHALFTASTTPDPGT